MIESLTILNFQNHDHFVISFSPTLTCLWGKSFAGKSAILRCLKWVCTNSPRGSKFVGQWGKAKYALGKLKIDGHTIIRKKGKGINVYKLDGRLLKVPKTSVPQSIADIINVGPANFQNQIEPPFWFTQSPPEVSRRLNAIINLHSIDRGLERVAARVRQCKAKYDVSTERFIEQRLMAKQSLWAVSFASQVDVLEELTFKLDNCQKRSSRIASAVDGIERASGTVRRAGRGIKLARAAVSAAERHRTVTAKLDALRGADSAITRLSELSSTKLPDPAELIRLRDRAIERRRSVQKLSSAVFGLQNLNWEITDKSRRIRKLEVEVKTRFKERCPVCGNKLNPSRSIVGTCTSHTKYL